MNVDNDMLRKKANKSISLIREKGVDKGVAILSESQTREFNVENGEFTLMRTLFDENIGVLVYKNHKKGSYGTNKISDTDIENAVDAAITSTEAAEPDEANDIAPYQGEFKENKGTYEPDTELLFKRTQEFISDIREKYPKVVIVMLIMSHSRKHRVYMNTNGTVCEEYTGSYGCTVEMSAKEGDKTTSLLYCGFKMTDLGSPFIEKPQVIRILDTAVKQLEARSMEGKFTGTMVLSPECFGSFMYAIADMAGGSAVLNKTSIWLDKLGKGIADPRISIEVNPNDDRVICGETVTGEGFKAEPYNFIKDGKLETFIIDYYLSRKTGYPMAKNDSYNFIVKQGDEPLEKLISRVKKGILVGNFSGGEPGVNGEFSGVAKNSFLIEDGEIKGALTETMINGNFADMLNNLIGISAEVECDGNTVLPYAAFDGIVVSGK